MTTVSSTPTRRPVVATSATSDRAGGFLSAALSYARTPHTGERNSVDVPRETPFHPVQRIATARRSDRETEIHQFRTARQAMIQALLRYWGRDFDPRMAEPQLDPLPEFKAETEVGIAVHETPIVFVVDDDVSVRESLELLVRSAGWQSETFESAREFLSHPRVPCPSCLVLDVTLPDLNGLELQKWVAVERPGMPIIFITGHGDIPMTVQAMKGGALEFLTKPFADHVLLNAISQALELSRIAIGYDAEVRELRDRYASLSPREAEVMALVVRGLLNKLIGAKLGISEITVKAHRGRVMQKMAARSLPALVMMAATLGIPVPKA
jgi:FixJ family two-component response regulator